jgi:hypothetical protein
MTKLNYEDFCLQVRDVASQDKLLPTFRKQHVPSKGREAFSQQRSITSQKTGVPSCIDAKNSKLAINA